MNIDDLLQSTKPIIFETETETHPYKYSGTCYPIKYNGSLFIVSASHCYKNLNINPENTLYPRPDDPRSFFAFDEKYKIQSLETNDNVHCDLVILRVARSHHTQEEMDKVHALDLAIPSNAKLPTSRDINDLRIRGYPHDALRHRIDYAQQIISQQAYSTNGYIDIKPGPYDFCYSIRMSTPIPPGMHPNGMSGSPVYGITHANQPVYCGTLIQYSETDLIYVAIGPEILVNGLKGLDAEESPIN